MSAFAADFAARFALAADAAGLRVVVLVRPKDCTVRPYTVRAALERPTVSTGSNALSTDWRIEYLRADAPDLEEGDQVEIAEQLYAVRQRPESSERAGDSATFMLATLTRLDNCGEA